MTWGLRPTAGVLTTTGMPSNLALYREVPVPWRRSSTSRRELHSMVLGLGKWAKPGQDVESFNSDRYRAARAGRNEIGVPSLAARYLSNDFRWMGRVERSMDSPLRAVANYRTKLWWKRTQAVGETQDQKSKGQMEA